MNDLDLLRLYWGVGFVLFLILTCSAALLCRFVWIRPSGARRAAMRLGLFLFALLATIFVLEFIFAFVIVQSDGYGQTLAWRLWSRRYSQPVNSRGYRDYEAKHFAGRSVIFMVGDSFVAGHGVRRIEDRFANRLAALLGDGWEHVVIARNGWDTGTELSAVKEYPIRPDVIILSYYINDIEGAARRRGALLPRLVRPPGRVTGWAVDRSFFLNWLYWRVYRGSLGDEYWNYLQGAYSDPDIWNAHAGELWAFVEHARSRGAETGAVVWPSLIRVSQSRTFTNRAGELLRGQGVFVVDLAQIFEGRPSAELTVNRLDAHPNPATHREVAALIYRELSIRGLDK